MSFLSDLVGNLPSQMPGLPGIPGLPGGIPGLPGMSHGGFPGLPNLLGGGGGWSGNFNNAGAAQPGPGQPGGWLDATGNFTPTNLQSMLNMMGERPPPNYSNGGAYNGGLI